jgi:hypothetical protein
MLRMFLLSLGEDHYVIQVRDADYVLKVRKCAVHVALERGWCVCQSKGHYLVFKVAIVCLEYCLLFITFLDMDAVICVPQI